MNLTGKLEVRVTYRHGVIERCHSDLQRPLKAVQQLLMRPGTGPDEAIKLIPMLFSLCSDAQSVAAQRALESARGQVPDLATEQCREQLIALERIRETLMRLVQDWELPLPKSGLKQLIKDLRMQAERCHQGLACEPQAFARDWQALRPNPVKLDKWLTHICAPFGNIHCNGNDYLALSADKLPGIMATPDEARTVKATLPVTGPAERLAAGGNLAEMLQQELSARLASIDADLATLAQPEVRAAAESGTGLALTARGWLAHRIELDGDQVSNWQIAAPTDWNFVPGGVLDSALAGVRVEREQLQTTLDALVLALDPCTGYEVVIEYA